VSSVRAAAARRRGHQVVCAPDAQLPFPESSFDLVTSTHVIEHVPDDHEHAEQLQRLVKPGGLVYVETPVKLAGAWYFRRNPQAGWVLDPTHVREYRSAEAVNDVIRSAGLEIVAEDLTPIVFPLAAAELLVRRVLRLRPRPAGRLNAVRAFGVRIPRYRQQAVLARRPG
jgi:2-polyprenyl-3-methyl-5-hydroxy-6-metoxy-1,4-benzoquinol methylase